MNTQRISLDISKIIDVPPVVRIGQGDNAGTTIVARIFDNGTSTNLDGMTARFCMRLPDGTHYVRDSECTVSGNTVTYVVDESHCAAVKGMTDEAYFDILADGEIVYSTSRFSVHVLRGVTDGAVPGETYDSAIEEAIQRAYEAAEAAEEAAGGVTPLMSESTLGGAKLGDGLALTGEKLGVSPITTSQIDTIANDESVTSTNVLNGTRLTYLWSKIKAKFAAITHKHAASDIDSGTLDAARIPNLSTDKLTSGTLPIARGGTGLDASPSMLTNLGSTTAANVMQASPRPGVTGTLAIANGGTNATTAADAVENIVDGQNINPASVAATGEVSGKSGTTTHKLTEKAESKAIAYVESTTATANHATGDYFMLGGVLMRATAAIATGETISASNAVPATVQAQIDALRDSVSENILPSATGQNNVRFSRCYRTCTVNIYLTQSIEFGTTYKWIATVPADARPANDIYAPVFDSAGNPLGGTLCIATTGGVGIKLSATATPFVLTNIAWVV